MKVVKLIAENVKKLKAVEIVPEGNVVKITGANEQGKTTVLDCIWWAIGGTKNIQEQPIRQGEKKASIVLDLGDMIVTRKFTESGSTLEVKNPQGLKYPKPQDMLDKFIGKFSLDPLAFARADKKSQLDTLLGIVNIAVDKDKLGSLAGVVVAESANPLDTINAVYKTVFDSRTAINRDRDRARSNYESKEGATEAKAVSISELVTEKTKIEEFNRGNETQRKSLEILINKANAADTDHSALISERDAIETNLTEEIADLERRLAAKTKELENAKAEKVDLIKASKVNVEKVHSDVAAARESVANLKDKDLSDVNARIANADDTNRKARKWDEYLLAKDEYEKEEAKSADCTARLKSIMGYKDELMKAAKFPIDGLDFKNGGVYYQDLPFEQASSAQKLTVSLSVAMAINPQFRVIRVNDGSLLDKKHMTILEQMAADNDYQVWVEEVDESGEVGIYIEDGEVKHVEVVK